MRLWIHQEIPHPPRQGVAPSFGFLNAGNPESVPEARAGEVGSGGVRSGEAVRIRFRRGNILLVMQGRAMGSGAVGDTVSVRLPSRIKGFEGTVTASGEVEVAIP